ncbi:MAG: hypothetical protein O2821_01320 [Chloroflexi bacterium]|nr:hypothetical protein [Chloroflexota bacterium]MDA1226834.1 hypothetical protein [Chloroflexota bacterium]
MGSEVTFYDYVNSSGENEISQWLRDVGGGGKDSIRVKARFTNTLLHLEGDYPTNWKRPSVDSLHGSCHGLFEIRHEISRIQYRLIGFHGPDKGTATLIFGAKEVGGNFEPRDTCERAQGVRALVESEPVKYRREHDYS